jgi:hypothetical protein
VKLEKAMDIMAYNDRLSDPMETYLGEPMLDETFNTSLETHETFSHAQRSDIGKIDVFEISSKVFSCRASSTGFWIRTK